MEDGKEDERRGNVTLRDVIRRGCDMWHVRAQSLPLSSLTSLPASAKEIRNSSACSSVSVTFSSVDIWRLCQGGRGFSRWRHFSKLKEEMRRFVICARKLRRARVLAGSSRVDGWPLEEQKLKSCLMRSNSLQTQRQQELDISARLPKARKWGCDFSSVSLCPLCLFPPPPCLHGLLPSRLIVELALLPFHFELSIDTSFLN